MRSGKWQVSSGREYTSVIAKPRVIGVVGSRILPLSQGVWVGEVVDDLLDRGNHLATGGALGTDEFVLLRLLRTGYSSHCTVFAAWKGYEGFPIKVRAAVRQFKDYGGHIAWGPAAKNDAVVKAALLMRNIRLVDACYGIVAFITPDSRGTVFTIKKAAAKRKPLVVFPVSAQASTGTPVDFDILPDIADVKWVPLRCGGVWEGAVKAVYLR